MLIKKHNTATWFKDKDILDYFKDDFEKNTFGKGQFKVSETIYKNFNNNLADAIVSLGNIIIGGLVSHPKFKRISNDVEFDWLLPETQWELKQAVCEGIQHLVKNRTFYEKVVGSGITGGTFTYSKDTNSWLLKSDIFGKIAEHSILASGIADYKIVGDSIIGELRGDGNNNIVIQKWNNTFKDKYLGDYLSVADFISAYAEPFARYDYFTIDRKSYEYRFEGGDKTLATSYRNITTAMICGTKYLVYKSNVIMGERGLPGPDTTFGDGTSTSGQSRAVTLDEFNTIDTIKDIPFLEDDYTDINDFLDKAENGEFVWYNLKPDGTATESRIYQKTASGLIEYVNKADTDVDIEAKATEVLQYVNEVKTDLETVDIKHTNDIATNEFEIDIVKKELNLDGVSEEIISSERILSSANTLTTENKAYFILDPTRFPDGASISKFTIYDNTTNLWLEDDNGKLLNFVNTIDHTEQFRRKYNTAQKWTITVEEVDGVRYLSLINNTRPDFGDGLLMNVRESITESGTGITLKQQVETNVANITSNTTNITANATTIGDNTTAIGVNTTAIGTNATNVGLNTTAIGTNATAIGANTLNITANTNDIATLRSIGRYRGTYADIAERDAAITTPNDGDYTLIGTAAPFIEWVYDGNGLVWEQAGSSGGVTSTFGDGAATNTQSRAVTNTEFTGLAEALGNKFEGVFADPAKMAEFLAITDTVAANQFMGIRNIYSITLPNVTTIESNSFQSCRKLATLNLPNVITIEDSGFTYGAINLKLLSLPEATTIGDESFLQAGIESLYIPKATTIGEYAFYSIVNNAETLVVMLSQFNTDAEKDRIFGAGHWDQITFSWL